MTVVAAQTEIQLAFPNFKIHTIEYLNEGMDSVVFLVNDETIFRFAKRAKTSGLGGGLAVEIKLLPELERRLTVRIPHFTHVGTQQNGLPLVSYQKIPGLALSPELLAGLNETERKNVFQTLAEFLQQVHAFPLDLAVQYGVEVKDFKLQYSADRERAQRQVLPLLTPAHQAHVLTISANYLETADNFTYLPTLLHADLSLEHVFYDASTKQVTGVIDFGDVIIGDPDYDYMYLFRDYGPQALEYLGEYTPDFNKPKIRQKVEFFRQWNLIQDVMFFQDIGDEAGAEEAVVELRGLIEIKPSQLNL